MLWESVIGGQVSIGVIKSSLDEAFEPLDNGFSQPAMR